MSNRLFAILLLVVIGGTFYGAYYYFFVANVWSVTINIVNTEAMEVRFKGEFKNDYYALCEKSCTLENIPTTNYTVTVGKKGYETVEKSIKVNRSETQSLSFSLKKEITLVPYKESNTDKIRSIKLKNSLLSSLANTGSISLLWYSEPNLYYSDVQEGKLNVFKYNGESSTEILSLDTAGIRKLDFNENEGYILVDQDGRQRLLRLREGIEESLSVKETILGIKDIDKKRWIITTENGMQTYDSVKKSYSRSYPYTDIAILPKGQILGLVSKKDSDKAALLNVTEEGKSIFFVQNLSENTRNIIYTTDHDIALVELHNNTVIATDREGKKYSLTNVIQ